MVVVSCCLLWVICSLSVDLICCVFVVCVLLFNVCSLLFVVCCVLRVCCCCLLCVVGCVLLLMMSLIVACWNDVFVSRCVD